MIMLKDYVKKKRSLEKNESKLMETVFVNQKIIRKMNIYHD